MRAFAAVSLALLAAAVLSGCMSSSTTTSSATTPVSQPTSAGPVVDSTTYTITLVEFNGNPSPQYTQAVNFTWPEVRNGTDFTFKEKIDGSVVVTSNHIGGHFGTAKNDAPTTTNYPQACTHITDATKIPGTFTIHCTAPTQTGVYHLRGHARVTQGSGDVSWWSDDFTFRVV